MKEIYINYNADDGAIIEMYDDAAFVAEGSPEPFIMADESDVIAKQAQGTLYVDVENKSLAVRPIPKITIYSKWRLGQAIVAAGLSSTLSQLLQANTDFYVLWLSIFDEFPSNTTTAGGENVVELIVGTVVAGGFATQEQAEAILKQAEVS